MKKNYFIPIRKARFLSVLITSFLSISLVFGQPVVQIYQLVKFKENLCNQYQYRSYPEIAITESSSKDAEIANQSTSKSHPFVSNTSLKASNNRTYPAIETKAIIGKNHSTDQDNPLDNTFTVILPDSVILTHTKAVLQYSLYGVAQGSHTTKSINGEAAYGGLIVNKNNRWTQIKEVLPTSQLHAGTNEIYFTRRENKDYQYEIKDLSLQLIPKEENELEILDGSIYKYDGIGYLVGSVTNRNINSIIVGRDTLVVNNGIFDGLIRTLPSTESVQVSYTTEDGLLKRAIINISSEQQTADLVFETEKSPQIVRLFNLNECEATHDELTLMRDEPASIATRGLFFKDLHLTNSELVNVTAGRFAGYRINYLDKLDSIPLKIALGFDNEKIPQGYTANDVKTFYYDRFLKQWKVLPVDSLDYQNKSIITYFNGDTDYINGVIKVPEMPETSSFTPTTITDMEYANPSTGVVSIAPPTPNSTGSASTSFPIKIPSGRNGMQPSLSVNYNSEGGNSWMGLGWNLQLPAITLNTKWGAPRFSGQYETEMYLLDGQELVLKDGSNYTNPNRTDNILRNSDRIFYLRKEGSYLKIERKGSNPTNYFWIVTDKQGNKNYYGGKTSVLSSYVIRTDDGDSNTVDNIVHWALYRSEDMYGNYVNYTYYNQAEDIVSGLSANAFYPSEIQYTRHASASSFYRVRFRRSKNNTATLNYSVGNTSAYNRPDVIITGRNGVLQYTKDVLQEIWVELSDNGTTKPIRKYRFGYDVTTFGKTQLAEIAEYSPNNPSTTSTGYSLFYTNTMEYYNDIDENNLFNSTTPWNGSSDEEVEDNPLSSQVPSSYAMINSALGSSSSSGWSAGLRIGIGIGGLLKDKNMSLGGGFNYSRNTQRELVSLVDVNGDGLPDNVYNSGGGVYYHPNNGSGFATASQTPELSALNDLSKTVSRTTGGSVDAVFFANISASTSKTRSNTDNYFLDINADGLPDIVRNGTVYFNKPTNVNNPGDFDRSFELGIEHTENAILPGNVDGSIVSDLKLPTLLELREEHPQFDAVKVWEAPYTGTVTISGQAKLIGKNLNDGFANNFRVTVEKAGVNSTSAATWLPNNSNHTSETLTSLNQIKSMSFSGTKAVSVNKGDLLFFRMHNLTEGGGGTIEWNPIVNYSTTSSASFNFLDDNNKQSNAFNSQNDFLLTGGSLFEAEATTSVSVNYNFLTANFTANAFTDDIYFNVKKIRYYIDNDDVAPQLLATYYRKYNHLTGSLSNIFTVTSSGTTSSSSTTLNTNVSVSSNANGNYREVLYFTVESSSNVLWENIKWQPKITLPGNNVQYPEVDYKIYNDNVNQKVHKIEGTSLPNPVVTPSPDNSGESFVVINHNLSNTSSFSNDFNSIPQTEFPIPLHWVVKEKINGLVQVLYKETYYVERTWNSTTQSYNYSFDVSSNHSPYVLARGKVAELRSNSNKLFTAFYSTRKEVADKFNQAQINFTLDPNVTTTTWNGLIFQKPFFINVPNKFGQPNRGWGQFMYNGGVKLQRNNQTDEVIYNNGVAQGEYYGENPIDMGVFPDEADYSNLEGDLQSIEDADDLDSGNISTSPSTPRYSFYKMDNLNGIYTNEAIIMETGDPNILASHQNQGTSLYYSLGRFGESSLYDVYVDPDDLINGNGFVGISQYSVSKGTTIGGGYGPGTVSTSDSDSEVLNQYVDLNGDRYPDLITGNKVQYTNALGQPSETKANGFIVTSSGDNRYLGVSMLPPNATESSNGNKTGIITNLNISSGIGGGTGSSTDKTTWSDINGDGLPDKIRMADGKLMASLNTGYAFTNEVTWGTSLDLTTSQSVNGNAGGSFSTPNGSWAIGAGFNTSFATRNSMLVDVNGDGLPDWVQDSGSGYSYRLNTGKGFSTTSSTFLSSGRIGEDQSFGGNLYGTFTFGTIIFSLFGLSIKLNFTPSAGVSSGANYKTAGMQDMNGDGFIDIINRNAQDSGLNVRLSNIAETNLLKRVNLPMGGSWTVTYEKNGNTYDLPQNKWVMNEIIVHDGFDDDNTYDQLTSRTAISYEDPNYDRREREFLGYGKVTIEEKNPSSGTTYRYSVTEYHNENIYLSGIEKKTSLYTGGHTLLSTSSTLYNLLSPDAPVVNLYADENTNYLQSGLDVALLDRSRLFVAPVKLITYTYEGSSALRHEQQFTNYDSNGNLLEYKDLGDTYAASVSSGGDAYRTELEYYTSAQMNSQIDNAVGFVKSIKVKRIADEELMRQRNAEYNNKGKLSKVITSLNANTSQVNTVTVEYDIYGNMNKINLLDSQDGSGNHFFQTLEYDNVVHSYPTKLQDAFNQVSTATYDYQFGVPTLSTDMNGQQLRTRLDSRGRIVEVTAPNEMPNGWTIRMEYENEATLTGNGTGTMVSATGSFTAVNPGDALPLGALHHAVTRHNVPDANQGQLLTVSLTDGLGEAVQLKKTMYSSSVRWLISGKEKKDPYGRVTDSYLPTNQTGYPTNINSLSGTTSVFTYQTSVSSNPTHMTYDERDRILTVKQPGESQNAQTEYGIEEGMFTTLVTNEKQQTFKSFTDVRGRQRKTIQNSELTTEFYYNAISENVKVKDHQGYETLYRYDMVGRLIESYHPDRGLQAFAYDNAGNMIASTNSVLMDASSQVTYQYTFNRLDAIIYPPGTNGVSGNNIEYTYGTPGDTESVSNNAVGRILRQKDASGVQAFGYDKLGNMTTQLRSISVAGRHSFWFLTRWQYDSFNRVRSITYPDEEMVNYEYNEGGSLKKVTGSIQGVTNPIVKNIVYDAYGDRSSITYGNNAVSVYTYDTRRRLKTVEFKFYDNSNTFLYSHKKQYGYDALSNILNTQTLSNTTLTNGALGGPVSHTYTYDNYNRLKTATGRYTGSDDLNTSGNQAYLAQEYSLEMKYDLSHNITSKTQTHRWGSVSSISGNIANPETMMETNYHLAYGGYASAAYTTSSSISGTGEFGYVQPHAPREIIEMPEENCCGETSPQYKKTLIDYDKNGNQTTVKQVVGTEDELSEPVEMTLQKNLWDEENRLRAVDLNPDETSAHALAVYTYDAGGQRAVRYVPGRVDVWSNSKVSSQNQWDQIVLYPSPMVTARVIANPAEASPGNENVLTYTKHYYAGAERVSSTIGTHPNLGLYPNDPTLAVFTNIRTDANENVITATDDLRETYTDLGQDVSLDTPIIESVMGSGSRKHKMELYDAYYYQNDHLGSSSYISGRNGTITQHMEYLPFGELLVDEHLNSYNSPFKFNGKELDDETGNYYYGARYYNPKTSIWLSVDPLADMYPGWSPYNYTLQNPVRLVDPDGRAPFDTYGVNANGDITHLDNKKYYDDKGNEVDKLVVLDSKGDRTNKSVNVEKNVLNGVTSDKDGKGRSYDYFYAKNNESTLELFEFLATETDVEWSKVSENNNSWITTSHSKNKEWGGSDTLFSLLAEGKGGSNSYEHIHSHPKEGGIPGYSGPSGFDKRDIHYGAGDKKFAKSVNDSYKNEFVKLRVYDAKTKEYILYDHRGSINRKKKL